MPPRGIESLSVNSKAPVYKQFPKNTSFDLFTSLTNLVQIYPDLAEIVKVWPELPENMKATIKTLIQNHSKCAK